MTLTRYRFANIVCKFRVETVRVPGGGGIRIGRGSARELPMSSFGNRASVGVKGELGIPEDAEAVSGCDAFGVVERLVWG